MNSEKTINELAAFAIAHFNTGYDCRACPVFDMCRGEETFDHCVVELLQRAGMLMEIQSES